MSDLKLTRLCAEAMGLVEVAHPIAPVEPPAIWVRHPDLRQGFYNPMGMGEWQDAQAMALVKRFRLRVFGNGPPYSLTPTAWIVELGGNRAEVHNADLNRAIVECVARLHSSQSPRG